VNGENIFHKLNAPKFHLLVFSNGESNHSGICEEVQRQLDEVTDCHVIPIGPRVREIFEKENDFVVFLRPDNHIAFISADMSLDAVRAYLNRSAER
jgi:hypothetical protein